MSFFSVLRELGFVEIFLLDILTVLFVRPALEWTSVSACHHQYRAAIPGRRPRRAVSAQRLKHCQFVHGDFLSVTYLKQPSGWNDWEW